MRCVHRLHLTPDYVLQISSSYSYITCLLETKYKLLDYKKQTKNILPHKQSPILLGTIYNNAILLLYLRG